MRRIRVTGRFYVFLAMLLVGLFFLGREFLFTKSASEALVINGYAMINASMEAVIVRDESVASYEGEGRVSYLVEEGAQVRKGQAVVNLYTASHMTKAFAELETVRANIRTFYQKLLSGVIEPELDRLEANVQAQALEMKRLVQSRQVGNLINVEKALEQTMAERQAYLDSHRRDEQKLNDYYNSEKKMLQNIEAWKVVKSADKDGVVSFYLDGYERQLTPEKMAELTVEQVKLVLAGKPLSAAKTANARMTKDVFKVATTDSWHVVLYSTDADWNPVKGQVFQIQMEGVSGFSFNGTVQSVQKSRGEVMVTVEVSGDIGPMLLRRSGKVSIGARLTGFTVPRSAIADMNGRTVVWLKDAAGGTPIDVEVLQTNDEYALIEPMVVGTLRLGQVVMLQ